MACKLTWSPTARLDLRNIFDYIAQDDPSAALGTPRIQ
ncbi:type II toxin-antitoxin system RelE/ParE family toxin [Candidatus Sumerlaeota bacterium]|nr:type II toxin-antitoxin system RelE/ParE family toxin [Candidatus Sumerlaeota bacterium]